MPCSFVWFDLLLYDVLTTFSVVVSNRQVNQRDAMNQMNLKSNMWCDLGKSVLSLICDIFSFLFDWNLLKTPLELDQCFKSYSNWKTLKTIENKRKSFFSGYISQPMLLTSDWLCKITTYIVHSLVLWKMISNSWLYW